MGEALCVKDLCKTYVTNKRQNNVLKNVNFTIMEGEMAAVMGPSGSGKSTLLYSVSGMDRPTAGEVRLGGKRITDLKEKELANVRLTSMGFIFQQMHMLKNLSTEKEVLKNETSIRAGRFGRINEMISAGPATRKKKMIEYEEEEILAERLFKLY